VRGITWQHPRADQPLIEASREFEQAHGVVVTWDARSLYSFGVTRLDALAREYDLIVLDHPHVGDAAARGYLAPLDELLPPQQLAALARAGVGPTHRSYDYGGHQWALAIDAAAQVSAWRADLPELAPRTWDEVVEAARRGLVIWPLCPVDAYASLLSIAANLGTPGGASPECFLEEPAGLAVLETMTAVAAQLPRSCFEMNPIDALELLAGSDGPPRYTPLLFGYSNYARAGFRSSLLHFGDMPEMRAGAGPAGSLLGGAGLAVSAFSEDSAAAAAFAAFVASGPVQAGTYVRAGGQPANIEAWDSAEANRLTSGFFEDTRATLEASWLRPRHEGYLSFQEQGMEITHRHLIGELGASQTVAALNRAYRESQEGT
jgi:multiple sugar transport system substrate-binding protein